jgi:hypothetical protein
MSSKLLEQLSILYAFAPKYDASRSVVGTGVHWTLY